MALAPPNKLGPIFSWFRQKAGCQYCHLQVEQLETRDLLSSNVVLDWNATLLEAIRVDKTPPPPASRAMAMVHVAMYDAIDSIEPAASLFPLPGLPVRPPHGASGGVAGAAAANRVLDNLFPLQAGAFDRQFNDFVAQFPKGNSLIIPRSIAFGDAVADAVLAWRATDGSSRVVSYTPGTQPGQWQPTPPTFSPAAFPQWAALTPFAISSGSQFRPAGPPALTSQAYANALQEVEALGSTNSTTRTLVQSQIALFWADGAGTETPPGHWNEIAEQVSRTHGDTLVQDAQCNESFSRFSCFL